MTILPPVRCPDCCGLIRETVEPGNAVTHWCDNPVCPARLKDMLAYCATEPVLNIEGLDRDTIIRLVDGGFVLSLPDLYEFGDEAKRGMEAVAGDEFAAQLERQGFRASAILAMIQSLDDARHRGWHRWIAALNIPGIGTGTGRVLAEHLRLQSDQFADLPRLIEERCRGSMEGIGAKRTVLLAQAASSEFHLTCQRLHRAGVRPREMILATAGQQPLEGQVFCITGEFLAIGSRDYIASKLASLGAVVRTAVTRKVTHLLVGDEPGQKKLATAREYGVERLDEAWLDDLFRQHQIKRVGGEFQPEAV